MKLEKLRLSNKDFESGIDPHERKEQHIQNMALNLQDAMRQPEVSTPLTSPAVLPSPTSNPLFNRPEDSCSTAAGGAAAGSTTVSSTAAASTAAPNSKQAHLCIRMPYF